VIPDQKKRVMASRNHTVIYEPAENGGYYAHIPALNVTTEGETLAEAKEMAKDAIENKLECLRSLRG
jgi:predicted RNase H-like HicB family nuclease